MTTPPAVAASGIGKVFGPSGALGRLVRRSPRLHPVEALHDVSFAVEPGAVVALVGGNGAGKSTLLRILATLVTPTAGTAQVGGVDVCRAEARRYLSLASTDERAFSQRLSGRENLEFFAALHALPPARADEVLDEVGLEDAADDAFLTYSTGMRQRLALARALLPAAPVLLLDEPFRALDAEGAARVRAIIGQRARAGATTLVATHNRAELEGLWTAELALDSGRVVHWGDPR
jgi:ABC-2 type transport system ATP-binding protein